MYHRTKDDKRGKCVLGDSRDVAGCVWVREGREYLEFEGGNRPIARVLVSPVCRLLLCFRVGFEGHARATILGRRAYGGIIRSVRLIVIVCPIIA